MKKTLSLILVTFAFTVQAQITSTFDSDADGWTFLNSATTVTPNYSTTGGNPAGFISLTYSANTATGTQNWVAPAKFCGNHLVLSLGMNLNFDLQQSGAGTSSSINGDVRIESSSVNLVYSLPAKPATTPAWSSYSIRLDETQGWRVYTTTGAVATRDQIKAALRNIRSIEIRGTYATNASYLSGIDNVVLEERTLPVAPAVTSFAPTSGKAGTTLTITGNNFDATASNNVVYFGLMRATINSASATQITVTVPVGATHDYITVINKVTGLSQNSHLPFNPTFDGGGRIIPASFAPRVDLFFSFDKKGFSMFDIDGDGWVDLAGASNSSDAVEIYRNLGLGGEITTASFAARLSINIPGSGTNGTGLGFADLDGDGLKDMVSSSGTSPFAAAFVTFRNISTPGNIAFDLPEIWSASSDESPIEHIADLDGDGRPELMGGESSISSSTSTYFWADQNISTPGNIEFGPAIGFFNGTVINGLSTATTGDLDGDGKNELIVTHNQGGSFTILRNISTPGLPTFENTFTISTGIASLTAADVNMDGKNDLLWKTGLAGDIHIRLNTNTGGALSLSDFATEVILTGDVSGYGGFSIADINGDNKPDIVATDNTDIGVYENVFSGGTFDANAFVRSYQYQGGGATSYPTGPSAVDLNGDNKPDLIFATTNGSPSRLSILENKNVHAPVISVNTVSPLAGPIGSTVTITGSNFSTIASENRVGFGGVEANVISSTATEIKAEVPAGAGYERVSVVRNKLTSYYHLPFNVTFSPGVTFDGTSFLPPVTLPLTTADYDVEVADLNNDGKPDIVAESDVSFFNGLVYRNVHTTGAITSASLLLDDTTSTASQDIKLMDVDADGKLDILSSHGIYKNSSTTNEISFDVAGGLNNLRISSWADFNLDGMIDIVSVTSGSGNLSVYENRYRGSGAFITGAYPSFSAAINFAKPAINGGAVSADFDNDGLVEFVSTNPTTDNVSIWRNTSAYRIVTSQFTSVGNIAAGDNPGRLYSGDIDVDGKMDFMLYHGAGTNSTLISVFHNQSTTGNIIFNKVDFTIPAAATVAHIRDLDGDGQPEIIVTSESTDQFFILKNTSTAGTINASSFAAPFITAVTNPRGLTTGDLNADGKPEIIITSAPNSLLIFENSVPTGPTISISSQPTSTAVCNGSNASLTLTATGASNLTYQWQKFDGSVFNNVTN
ncbi:MAG: FG-GAP-like repeat-containing protein, partial [Chryseolinea sp.]